MGRKKAHLTEVQEEQVGGGMLLRVSRRRRVETIWLRRKSEAAGAVVTAGCLWGLDQRQGLEKKVEKSSSHREHNQHEDHHRSSMSEKNGRVREEGDLAQSFKFGGVWGGLGLGHNVCLVVEKDARPRSSRGTPQ